MLDGVLLRRGVSTHSRPKAAGEASKIEQFKKEFQHTAARRRLVPLGIHRPSKRLVSTHSRPKAAG